MLEKNGEPIKVTKDYLEKEFGITRFPVTFQLVNKLMPKDPDTGRINKPRSFGVEPHFQTLNQDTGESISYRYYTGTKPMQVGTQTLTMYLPDNVVFTQNGTLTIGLKDADLIAYMAMHNRNAASNFRDESKKAQFYTVNEAKEADKIAYIAKMEAKVKGLLYPSSSKGGLREAKLRDVGKSYGLLNSDHLTLNEIRAYLSKVVIGKDPTLNKMEAFMERIGNDADVELLSTITTCRDLSIIHYNESKNKWYLLTETGKEDESLCSVRPGEDPVKRLANYLLNFDDKDVRAYLESLVEERQKTVEPA